MTQISKRVVHLKVVPESVPDNLMQDITRLLSEFSRVRLRLSSEVSNNLISEFYPSIEGIINRYDSRKSSFETYLFTLFRIFQKENHRRGRKRDQINRILRSGAVDYQTATLPSALLVAEDPSIPVIPQVLSRSDEAIRRRILCTVCRNAANLTSREIKLYTRILNLPDGWLLGVSIWTKTILADHFERLEKLREKRDLYYSRYIQCEDALLEYHDEEEKIRLRHRMEINAARLKRVREKIRKVKIHLSHAQLSSLLGIPKGSIDSCFSVIRRGLARSRIFEIRSSHENSSREQQSA